jgi:hypothetical protein
VHPPGGDRGGGEVGTEGEVRSTHQVGTEGEVRCTHQVGTEGALTRWGLRGRGGEGFVNIRIGIRVSGNSEESRS